MNKSTKPAQSAGDAVSNLDENIVAQILFYSPENFLSDEERKALQNVLRRLNTTNRDPEGIGMREYSRLCQKAGDEFRRLYGDFQAELLEAFRIAAIDRIVYMRNDVMQTIERIGWDGDPEAVEGVSFAERIATGQANEPPTYTMDKNPAEAEIVERFSPFVITSIILTHENLLIRTFDDETHNQAIDVLDSLVADRWHIELSNLELLNTVYNFVCSVPRRETLPKMRLKALCSQACDPAYMDEYADKPADVLAAIAKTAPYVVATHKEYIYNQVAFAELDAEAEAVLMATPREELITKHARETDHAMRAAYLAAAQWKDPSYGLIYYYLDELAVLRAYDAEHGTDYETQAIADLEKVCAGRDTVDRISEPPFSTPQLKSASVSVANIVRRFFHEAMPGKRENWAVPSHKQERHVDMGRYDNAPRLSYEIPKGMTVGGKTVELMDDEMRMVSGIVRDMFITGNNGEADSNKWHAVNISPYAVASVMYAGDTHSVPYKYVRRIDDIMMLLVRTWGRIEEYRNGQPKKAFEGYEIMARVIGYGRFDNSPYPIRYYRVTDIPFTAMAFCNERAIM